MKELYLIEEKPKTNNSPPFYSNRPPWSRVVTHKQLTSDQYNLALTSTLYNVYKIMSREELQKLRNSS